MAVELKKIDPSCNNFELIDSSECVANSRPKLNKVFTTSRDSLTEMINWLEGQEPTFTAFNAISSQMVVAALNIQKINNSFRAPYTTMQVLSAQWNKKPFSIYLPTLIDIIQYNFDPAFYRSVIIQYLNFNFAPNLYPPTQEINVFVTLTYTNIFEFIFSGSYQEICSPTARSATNTLTCNGCGGDNRYAFCNIKGRACGNAYRFCGTSKVSDNETFNCRGTVGDTIVFDNTFLPPATNIGTTGTLDIQYKALDLEDAFVCRVIRFKLRNRLDNNNETFWEFID